MGEYKGAGVDSRVRWELADRALSIGYGMDGAGRISDAAFWVDFGSANGECKIHPGCPTYVTEASCEACEIIRQSDERGWTMGMGGLTMPETLGERAARRTAERVATVHYRMPLKLRSACNRREAGDSDPRKTTCGLCKRTSDHSNALYNALKDDTREAFGNAGIRAGMLVRGRVSGALGVIRTIDTRCHVGYWGSTLPEVRGAENLTFPTPEVLMERVELITIDDLITVGSTVEYVGRTYTVTRVSMAEGVSLREVGTWRSGREVTPSEFAADLANGYLKITELAPSGAETDPIVTLINTAEAQAKRDLMATFAEGTFILVRDNSRIILAKITGMGESQVTYVRVDDCTRSRTVTFPQFQGYVSNKVITATTVATDETGDAVSITLHKGGNPYGTCVAESREVFRLSGAGLHNRYADHEIRAFYGTCCDDTEMIHFHLSSLPGVISDRPQPQPTRYAAMVGDVMLIDGRPWRITARKVADPILTPCQFEQR